MVLKKVLPNSYDAVYLGMHSHVVGTGTEEHLRQLTFRNVCKDTYFCQNKSKKKSEN